MLVSVTQPCGTVSEGGAYKLFYLLLHSLRSRGFTAIWCLILIQIYWSNSTPETRTCSLVQDLTLRLITKNYDDIGPDRGTV